MPWPFPEPWVGPSELEVISWPTDEFYGALDGLDHEFGGGNIGSLEGVGTGIMVGGLIGAVIGVMIGTRIRAFDRLLDW